MPRTERPTEPTDIAANHPGPQRRATRSAAGMTLSLTAYQARIDIGKLSKHERAQGDLSAAEARRLELVLRAGVRERAKAVEQVLAADHMNVEARV